MGVRVSGVQATIKFVDKVTESAVIGTAYEAGSRFQERTPVDTAFAKNSWIVTMSPNDYGTPGANNLEMRIALVNQMKLGQTIYINNGAEYIDILEKGHSQQAPRGMVAVTLPEVQDIANRQVDEARRTGR